MSTAASYLEYYANSHTMKSVSHDHSIEQANRTSCYQPSSIGTVNFNTVSNESATNPFKEITVKMEPHEKLSHCDLFRGKRNKLL